MTSESDGGAAHRHPFTYPDFRALWIARLCSTLAQNSMVIVIGWQVYDIARATMSTKDAALQLGVVGLVQFMPLFALTLVTGYAADRIDRRFISRACITLTLICALLLAGLTHMNRNSLVALFWIAGLLGVARAFSQPAMSALSPNLVPKPVLPRAIAVNAIAGRIGGIVGPAMGGYLYAADPAAPYAASAILLVASLLCALTIGPVGRATMAAARNPWAQMTDGLRYVLQHKLVLGAISLDLFAVLLGGATAMLPIFARDILQVGPSGLGHLRAAPAVGALATSGWFAYRPLRENVGVKMLAAVAIFGVATVIFGVSRWMPLSLGCLMVLGGADMLSVYVRQSLVQLSTPDDMRGRVSAVSTLFVSASNELGEAESGFLAALIGPVAAVVGGGIGAIAITFLWARWFPSLRAAKSFDHVVAKPN